MLLFEFLDPAPYLYCHLSGLHLFIHTYMYVPYLRLVNCLNVNFPQINDSKSMLVHDNYRIIKGTPWDETFSMLSILKI